MVACQIKERKWLCCTANIWKKTCGSSKEVQWTYETLYGLHELISEAVCMRRKWIQTAKTFKSSEPFTPSERLCWESAELFQALVYEEAVMTGPESHHAAKPCQRLGVIMRHVYRSGSVTRSSLFFYASRRHFSLHLQVAATSCTVQFLLPHCLHTNKDLLCLCRNGFPLKWFWCLCYPQKKIL